MTGRIRTGLPEVTDVDVLVVGLGATGAGCALDAATRGLRTLAVDAHDLAFGTSRWSSKLIHGGLRYLAKGQVGVAMESAIERGLLMEVTAPHLVRPLPLLVPVTSGNAGVAAGITRAGLRAGDLLRRSAHTSADLLPPPRHLGAREALALAPLRRAGLRGSLLSWDGQVEDDARLVTTIARTAASYGAEVRTHARVLTAGPGRATLRDDRTGATVEVRARAIVNATGVWADTLAPQIRLRPSRGTHLVLRPESIPGLGAGVYVPIPHTVNRFVLVLPQPDGQIYVGLTDEPIEGPVPDVPRPTEAEIGFLLDVIAGAFERPLHRGDVVGAFAGLRPLLDTGDGSTADMSRKHAILQHQGVTTVVGGKLTTYRRMAQDAIDALGLTAEPCRTRTTPLLGAASREVLARSAAHPRLVRRYGAEADLVLASAVEATGLSADELLAPATPGLPPLLAELVFGITHEGATTVDDLLDRRTRVGLVPTDRVAALAAAQRAIQLTRSFTF